MEGSGCPSEGSLFEEKGRLRGAVRRRVIFCAAKAERMRIQRRDKMFTAGAKSQTAWQKCNRCSKLIVDGDVISSPQSLMEVWAHHFSNLAKSKVGESLGLSNVDKANLLNATFVSNFNYSLPGLTQFLSDAPHSCPTDLLCTEDKVYNMLSIPLI